MLMETQTLYILIFTIVVLILFWMMPNSKIKAISNFIVSILTVLPLVGMIKAIIDLNKNRKSKT